MPRVILAALVGWLHVAASILAGDTEQAPRFRLDRSRYMGVDEVKRGMTGIGRTVLHGTELTEFKVSVVEVLRNWGPKQHAILVRCSGAGLEHSGIIAGMSGSPVYLEDPADGGKLKLIGAIAFGWLWNKDPIGGVQPIEHMLTLSGLEGQTGAVAPSEGGGSSAALPGQEPASSLNPEAQSRYAMVGLHAPVGCATVRLRRKAEAADGLQPLSTPLVVGKTHPAVMDYLRERLDGTTFWPVQGGGAVGGGEAPETFTPGGSLVVPFLIGDVDMAAVGTVTEVIGNRVIGFGHSMMAEGPIELPMATGWIHTAITLMPRSFKLGAMGKLVGTLVHDEETGVWGISGKPARMIPMPVSVREPDRVRTYRYQAMHHRMMTPWIITAGLMASVFAHRDLPQEHTVTYTMSVGYRQLGRFSVENVSSMRGLSEIQSDLAEPMSLLMDNPFGRATVDSVDVGVTVAPKASLVTLERAEIAREHYKPGEEVDVAIRWRPYRAEPFVRHYALTLPSDLQDGAYPLTVGSWQTQLNGIRTEKPHLFRIESLADILAASTRVATIRSDRVYMRLEVRRGGIAIGKTELPELPGFRRQIIDEAKLRAVQAYAEPIVVQHPVPFVAMGEQRFTIQVSRRANQ